MCFFSDRKFIIDFVIDLDPPVVPDVIIQLPILEQKIKSTHRTTSQSIKKSDEFSI